MADLIPDEVLRYVPTGDKLYIGAGKSIVRFIFYETEFTNFEKDRIEEFREYFASKQLGINCEIRDEEILRTLIGCKFDFGKTVKAIISSLRWKSEFMPDGIESLRLKAEPLLNSGCIYIHGRDHRYRPLIILNAGRFDLETYNSEDYSILLCYILEYCITHLMLPGRIENWIIITDLNNKSLSSLPISELKRVIKTLQDNFRCRMIVNYVVNAPRSLKFMWTVIKGFIEPHTVNKIRILREGQPKEMKQHFALTQIEKKYGGTAEDLIDNFWPPTLPSGPFETENETPGSHLLPKRDDLNDEIFYSVAETAFYTVRRTTDQSHQTIYADPAPIDPGCGSINIGETPLLDKKNDKEKVKEKKCCENCQVI